VFAIFFTKLVGKRGPDRSSAPKTQKAFIREKIAKIGPADPEIIVLQEIIKREKKKKKKERN